MSDASGQVIAETKYKAWGEVRQATGTSPTNYTYTGQYSYTADFGLMYYNARWYDPALGRFAQADSIVPGGVQGLDRYAYVNNSPLNYVDPSGHFTCSNNRDSDDYCPGQSSKGNVSLSKKAQDLVDFADSIGMTPEEVIGIGLGHEMFYETTDEQATHMEAFRNGFLRYVNENCYGNQTYNCMLNYFAGSYESVYNQFLTKESGYTERTSFWGNRDEYLRIQYINNQQQSNLGGGNQATVKSGIEFMGSFMNTISSFSYDPDLALNSGVVDAQALNVALGGYPTSEMGFLIIKSANCSNGAAAYSLIYNLWGEKKLDAAGLKAC